MTPKPTKISVDSKKGGGTLVTAVVTFPIKFKEGHVCSAIEADQLQNKLVIDAQTNLRRDPRFGEMIRNDAPQEELQAYAVKYFEGYEFGLKTQRAATPFAAELNAFARTTVLNKMMAANPSWTKADIEKDPKFKERVEQIKQSPKAHEIVKQRLAMSEGFDL